MSGGQRGGCQTRIRAHRCGLTGSCSGSLTHSRPADARSRHTTEFIAQSDVSHAWPAPHEVRKQTCTRDRLGLGRRKGLSRIAARSPRPAGLARGAPAIQRVSARHTYGNPLKYTDPSGHSVDCGIGEYRCQAGRIGPGAPPPSSLLKPGYQWQFVSPDNYNSWYYTPGASAQPGTNGGVTNNPNEWDRNNPDVDSLYKNAALQGSIVVGNELWKYDLGSESFQQHTNSCTTGGVAAAGGCLSPAQVTGRVDGKTVVVASVAVASCPGTKYCNPSSTHYNPNFQPAYEQLGPTIYIVTDDFILIADPLDSGGGLGASQTDVYRGIGPNSQVNPRNFHNGDAWIQVCVDQAKCGGN